eukprot:CAMPEP_0115017968 /NCGR_PEP_ID=MMETSP0216-20121206/28478_1 /TAXON_ID=223996 /ORGANISM="Protocruzia adherens, Strain Boccale" /LENGTH=404 /DNA_ID=CAMNT_0002388977 /DNA_START=23 /DNA_END=1234 /DNA_ORIENTATION=-
MRMNISESLRAYGRRTSYVNLELSKGKASLDKLILAFGGFSTFQLFNAVLISSTFIVGTLIVTLIPYMEIPGSLECLDSVTGNWFACSTETACSGSYDRRPQQGAMDNFINHFDLYCERNYLLGFIGSAFFLGAFFGSTIAGSLSDRFGRRPVLIIGNAVQVVVFSMMVMSSTIEYLLVFTLLAGFSTASCRTVSYVLFTEIVDKTHGAIPGTVVNTLNGSFQVVVVVLVYFIPHWKFLVILAFSPCLILLLKGRDLTESPNYLVDPHRNPKRIDDTVTLFSSMARWNGRQYDEDDLRDYVTYLIFRDSESATSNTQQKPRKAFNGLFHDKVLGKRAIVFMIIWFASSFAYYGVTFQIPTLSDNLNETLIIGATFGILDTIASVFTSALAKRYPKKYIVLVFFW